MISPLAEKRWPRRSDTARPWSRDRRQDFRRTECAGGEYDDGGFENDLAAFAAGGGGDDAPAAVSSLGDMAHCDFGEHFSAVAGGVGKIGQRDRVLGADVAAGAAVAAAGACGLRDTGGVNVFSEADGDARRHEIAVELAAGIGEYVVFCHLPARGSLAGRSQSSARA